MLFNEFCSKLSSVIRAGGSTDKFARTLFESILTDDGLEILNEYSSSSFKAFYNGNTTINKISQKINAYIEPAEFSSYIHSFPDAAVENLCNVFADFIPDIDLYNAGDKLSELFASIIIEAAGTTKNSPTKNDVTKIPPIILDAMNGIAPDLGTYQDGVLYMDIKKVENTEDNPFDKYLSASSSYFSTKKTLLYAEKPHPFYEMYVCNDIKYRKFRITGTRDPKSEITIGDVTIPKLEAESKYVIIEGIGGIGKSMLLTHLFLSSAEHSPKTGRTPLLLFLKNYKDTTSGVVDFIWKSVKEYDPTIKQKEIIDALQSKRLIILLDGLDEIQSSARQSFDQDLEAFVKSYPGNTIIITSRPTNSFVAYSKFSVFEIQELTKEQATMLIEKLEFWDDTAKTNFIAALDNRLYYSHRQFASNPLLLTIMLMTYTSFGEVPAKMHVFYSKAYETMARLHDASKGSFKRPLYTNLTPEDFAKYFAQFCARTYKDEVLEFDSRLFASYMTKVIKGSYAEQQGISPRDFLLDLTDNLCIMYREGEKYYFIHRSFQEYFAAVYFSTEYDSRLNKVGNFFEKMQHRSYSDRTFDMLYDMIPEKIERFIFLPFLEELLKECNKNGEDEAYWEFLDSQYPALYYTEGETGDSYYNDPQSFLYGKLINAMNLEAASDLDDYGWPDQIYELPTLNWYYIPRIIAESDHDAIYLDPDSISEECWDDTTLVSSDSLPYRYIDIYGEPDSQGITIEVEIYELRKAPKKYETLRRAMENAAFPLMREYQNVIKYYEELKAKTQKEDDADDLFDD